VIVPFLADMLRLCVAMLGVQTGSGAGIEAVTVTVSCAHAR
jgi:hypothetical protein